MEADAENQKQSINGNKQRSKYNIILTNKINSSNLWCPRPCGCGVE
jgi:hypothetical protein